MKVYHRLGQKKCENWLTDQLEVYRACSRMRGQLLIKANALQLASDMKLISKFNEGTLRIPLSAVCRLCLLQINARIRKLQFKLAVKQGRPFTLRSDHDAINYDAVMLSKLTQMINSEDDVAPVLEVLDGTFFGDDAFALQEHAATDDGQPAVNYCTGFLLAEEAIRPEDEATVAAMDHDVLAKMASVTKSAQIPVALSDPTPGIFNSSFHETREALEGTGAEELPKDVAQFVRNLIKAKPFRGMMEAYPAVAKYDDIASLKYWKHYQKVKSLNDLHLEFFTEVTADIRKWQPGGENQLRNGGLQMLCSALAQLLVTVLSDKVESTSSLPEGQRATLISLTGAIVRFSKIHASWLEDLRKRLLGDKQAAEEQSNIGDLSTAMKAFSDDWKQLQLLVPLLRALQSVSLELSVVQELSEFRHTTLGKFVQLTCSAEHRADRSWTSAYDNVSDTFKCIADTRASQLKTLDDSQQVACKTTLTSETVKLVSSYMAVKEAAKEVATFDDSTTTSELLDACTEAYKAVATYKGIAMDSVCKTHGYFVTVALLQHLWG